MPFDPNDKTKVLYDAVSKDYDLGTYDEFTTKLKDPTKRKAFYDGIGHEYDLGDYNTFEQKIGYDSKEIKQEKTTEDYFNAGLTPEQIQQKKSQPQQVVVQNNSQFLNIGEPVKQKVTKGVKPVTTTHQPNIKEAIDNHVNELAKQYQISDEGKPKLKAGIEQAYKRGELVPEKNSNGESVLKEGTGFLGSAGNAINKASQQQDENTYLSHADNKTAIEYLNRTKQFPETAIVKESKTAPSGFSGKAGEVVGENAEILAKGSVGALAGALSELTGGASFGTFLATAKDMAEGGYAEGLKKNYYALKEQHPEISDEEALSKAKKGALVHEAVGLTTSAILSKSLPIAKEEAATGFLNTVKQAAEHSVASAPKVLGATAAGSVVSDVADISQGADTDINQILQNATDKTKGMAVMHFGLGILPSIAKGALSEVSGMTPQMKAQVENAVASAPREEVSNFYKEAEQNGIVPEGTAEKVTEHLNNFDEHKKVVADLPIDEEQKAVIASRLANQKTIPDERANTTTEENQQKGTEVIHEETNAGTQPSNEPITAEEGGIAKGEVNENKQGTEESKVADIEKDYSKLIGKEVPAQYTNEGMHVGNGYKIIGFKDARNGDGDLIKGVQVEFSNGDKALITLTSLEHQIKGTDLEKLITQAPKQTLLENTAKNKQGTEENKGIPHKTSFNEGDTFPYWDNNKWVTAKLDGIQSKHQDGSGNTEWLAINTETGRPIKDFMPEKVINKYIESYNKEHQQTEPPKQTLLEDNNIVGDVVSDLNKGGKLGNTFQAKKYGSAEEIHKKLIDAGYKEVDLKDKSYNETIAILDKEIKKGFDPILVDKQGGSINDVYDWRRNTAFTDNMPYSVLLRPETKDTNIVEQPTEKIESANTEVPPQVPEEKATSIKNAVTKEEREQRGLKEVEVEARRTFGDVFDKGKELVDNGTINHLTLAEEVGKNPRPLKPEESTALLYGRMKLQNEHQQVSDLLKDAYANNDKAAQLELSVRQSKLEDDINSNDVAARKTGYEQGLGLAIRKVMIKQDYTLANQLQQYRNANGGEEIPKPVREKLQKLTTQLEEATKKFEEYEQRLKDLEAQKAINKNKGNGKKSDKDFGSEREDIFKSIKDKWNRASKGEQGLTAVPLPYAAQLYAIAPDVAKLVKSYAQQGVVKLSDIIDDIHANLVSGIPQIRKEDVRDLLAGEYNSTKQKAALTPQKMQLQANVEKIKDQINIEKYKLLQAKRTGFEKGLDWFAKFRRAVILSSVQTLGKLTSAASMRQATTFIEEVIGGGLSKIPGISKIAKGAPREGGINAKAEAKSISQWWKKATYRDIAQITKTGKGELDYLYGSKKDLPHSALDFIGHVHGALKAPAKRAEFFRSFEKRMDNAAKNGEDISEPTVQTRIASEAYVDANRAIFMQDNKLTAAYQRAVNYLEHEGGNVSKTGATALKVLLPIVKIPTNYVAETTSYALGYFKALPLIGRGLAKGLDSVTPEQKDYVLRNLKKGSVGAAFMALGYFNPQAIGGYYTGKRNQKDLKAGDLTLFGVSMPHWMTHAPLLEVLQMGATLRRVQDEYAIKGKGGGTEAAIGEVARGLAEEVPFINEQLSTSKAIEDKEGVSKFAGELAKSFVVPPDVERIAKARDVDENGNPNYRKPEGIIQNIESAIPGLREKVPLHPIIKTIDKENPIWDTLASKGVDLPQANKNTIHIPKDSKHPDGKMDDKEFNSFFKLREQKIITMLQEFKEGGVPINESGKPTVSENYADTKDLKDLTRDELVELMKSIQSKATDEAKEELFPTEETE